MAIAHQPFGQDVQQVTADEFGSGQGHDFGAVLPVVFVTLPNPVLVHAQQATVADRAAVSVASQVIHHTLGVVQTMLGIDNPVLTHQAVEQAIHFTRVRYPEQLACVGGLAQQ